MERQNIKLCILMLHVNTIFVHKLVKYLKHIQSKFLYIKTYFTVNLFQYLYINYIYLID